jgi:outer membrane lipoprotein LolB
MTAVLRAVLLSSLCLGGCALISANNIPVDQSAGRGALTHVAFSGRIAVRQNESGDSGKIEWQGNTAQQHVELLSPLGNTVATLDHSAQVVRLVMADHQEFVAANAQDLTQKILGYALPLEGLPWWVVGQAAPADAPLMGAAVVERNEKGELLALSQAGWRMEYGAWRNVGGQQLPGSLQLQRDALTIRLTMDRWNVERAAP